ncbi:DUF362 domain-containing protein [Thermodesulfobacteriota bacterium]
MKNKKSGDRTSLVSIMKSTYRSIDIPAVLDPLGGIGRFVKSGDQVLLKMNLLSAREPQEAVTTHPEFVRAIVSEVKKAGGIPYIGDSPAGVFSRRKLSNAYSRTGIEKMAKEEGIPLNYDTGSKKINLKEGKKLKRAPICNYALKADKIIGIPKLKTHSLQYLTLACKNMYGVVPGLVKAKYHALFPGRAGFGDMLLDLCVHIKPHLFIMDGILGLHGQGPAGDGDPIEMGMVLASKDPVALDIAVCRLIDVEPVGIPLLKRAKLRGIWPDRIDYPLLKPENNIIKGFKLPNTASHLQGGKKGRVKNPVITGKCEGCGECENICPKEAIKMVDDLAQVDYSICIRCYCCHEVCPFNAIKVRTLKKSERGR